MGLIESLLSPQLLFAALVTGSIYALIGLGLNLVFGTMRMLNVAHGDIVMIGAYATFWGFTVLGLSPLVAAPVVACLGAAVGVGLYRGLFKRLLTRMTAANAQRIESNSLLLFFGLSILMQNVTALIFTPNVQAYAYLDSVIRIGPLSMTVNRLLALLIAATTCIAVAWFLSRNIVGLAMRAVIERREAAQVVGVNLDQVQWQTFALGFGTAALAGTLISMLEQFSPFSGFPFTIAGFIVIILGGLGHVRNGLLAALLLGVIETYGVALTSANLRSVLLYGTFVAALLLFPHGLMSLGKKRS